MASMDFRLLLNESTVSAFSDVGERSGAPGHEHRVKAEKCLDKIMSTYAPEVNSDAIRSLGAYLFAYAFTPPVEALFREACGLSLHSGRKLRLSLSLSGVGIMRLPWEFLFDPIHERFLAASSSVTLSRSVPFTAITNKAKVAGRIRLAVVTASPSDQPNLAYGSEAAVIQSALDSNALVSTILDVRVANQCSIRALNRLIRDWSPHVVHFIGHGDDLEGGRLFFEDHAGRSQPANAELLSTLFLERRSVSMVVLNACNSATPLLSDSIAGLAYGVAFRGVPAVIAMQFRMSDNAAVRFSEELYQSLSRGWRVEDAVQEARRALLVEPTYSRLDFGVPVVFLRESAESPVRLIDNEDSAKNVDHLLAGSPRAWANARAWRIIPFDIGQSLTNDDITCLLQRLPLALTDCTVGLHTDHLHLEVALMDGTRFALYPDGVAVADISEQLQPLSVDSSGVVNFLKQRRHAHLSILGGVHAVCERIELFRKTVWDLLGCDSTQLRLSATAGWDFKGLSYVMSMHFVTMEQELLSSDTGKRFLLGICEPGIAGLPDSPSLALTAKTITDAEERFRKRISDPDLESRLHVQMLSLEGCCVSYASWSNVVVATSVTRLEFEERYRVLENDVQHAWFVFYMLKQEAVRQLREDQCDWSLRALQHYRRLVRLLWNQLQAVNPSEDTQYHQIRQGLVATSKLEMVYQQALDALMELEALTC